MNRVTLLLLFAAGALSAAFSIGEPRKTADAWCNPGRVDDNQVHSAGWLRKWWEVTGVYSNIRNYDPYVVPGPISGDWSLAYSMLTVPDHSRWAQVGWVKKPVNFRYLFTQTVKSDGQIITSFFGDRVPPINTYSYYTVLYGNYAPGWITYQVAGVDRHYIYTGWTPAEGQTVGEILTLASQLPGGVLSPEYFKDTHIYFAGAWQVFDGEIAFYRPEDSNYFGNVKQSSLQAKVWDKACTS